MSIRLAALLTLAVAPAFCADWNAQLAEQYMDSRQKEWIAVADRVCIPAWCVYLAIPA